MFGRTREDAFGRASLDGTIVAARPVAVPVSGICARVDGGRGTAALAVVDGTRICHHGGDNGQEGRQEELEMYLQSLARSS